MQIPLLLDRAHSETLTVQLFEQLREAIRQGRIPPGGRLPSSRHLAEQLDVARNTVTRAYELLHAEGYVVSRPSSGMFAVDVLPDAPPRESDVAALEGDATHAMPLPAPLRAQRLVNENRARVSFDFFPGRPAANLFPLKTWRRLSQVCLGQGAANLTEYGAPGGLAVLRAAIAHHVAAARGLVVDPAQVIVVNGVQEGLSIAARLFLRPGRTAAVEDPCYQGAAFAFEAAGADVASVPVDEDGLIHDLLPEAPTALLYVTPSHQYPTGHVLSAGRRSAIAEWSQRTGCYILEDDYDSDFRYEGSPLPALASIAPHSVIYLGTFSKSLGAGLRIGYMIVPPRLAEVAQTAKALLNNGNPWLEQAVLAEFMRSGSYATHLMRIRSRYRDSRDALLAALRRYFGEVHLSGEGGGLHVFWELPAGVPDAGILEALARRARVGIYSLPSAGAYEAKPSALSRRGVVLGYASMTPRQIEQGIERLSNAVDDALDTQMFDVNDLVGARALPWSRAPRTKPRKLAPRNRQRPALRIPPQASARSRTETRRSSSTMPFVSSIYRYPVKGLSAQRLTGVALAAGKPFPDDRVFALARPGSAFDEEDPQWAKKGMFVMLMLEEALASVRTDVDVATGRITIARGNEQLLAADLDTVEGRASVEAFVAGLVPTLRGQPKLLRSRGGHFMDKPDNVISLINLATVRRLQEQWGYEIDPLRFRANIYLDGAEPWEEFDWIGSDIRLGGALCNVDRRNGRCGATNVNPANGRRDLDIPGSLRAGFGHKDLGVYLTVTDGGAVAVGDQVEVARAEAPALAHGNAVPVHAPDRARSFICRGCYFIYEERTGVPAQSIPPGTRFADIPMTWRCPDCGSEKSTFRPYVAAPEGGNGR